MLPVQATASLDDALLQTIELALAACADRSTVLQIAHQTSAVVQCDMVLVMERGRVVQQGSPAELAMEASGEFKARMPNWKRVPFSGAFNIAHKAVLAGKW